MEKVYKTKVAIWLICAIIGFTVIPIIPVLGRNGHLVG